MQIDGVTIRAKEFNFKQINSNKHSLVNYINKSAKDILKILRTTHIICLVLTI